MKFARPAQDHLIFNILAAFAEFEREMMARESPTLVPD